MEFYFNETKRRILNGTIQIGLQKALVETYINKEKLKKENPRDIINKYHENTILRFPNSFRKLKNELKNNGFHEHYIILTKGISYNGKPVWAGFKDPYEELKKMEHIVFMDLIMESRSLSEQIHHKEQSFQNTLFFVKPFVKRKLDKEKETMAKKYEEITKRTMKNKETYWNIVGTKFYKKMILCGQVDEAINALQNLEQEIGVTIHLNNQQLSLDFFKREEYDICKKHLKTSGDNELIIAHKNDVYLSLMNFT